MGAGRYYLTPSFRRPNVREEIFMRHLIDPLDFSVKEIEVLLDTADAIAANPQAFCQVCQGKKLATLFYEASTRTRLSFEAAMLNLGGSILGFATADSSSAVKGESVADTIRIVSCYADICAMLHPKEGAPLRASRYSRIPVINAGDGGHQHPTQTLTDLMTIRRRRERLGGLTIGLCGDLKFGRTVHSLIKSLARYEGIKFILISPEELRAPDYIIEEVLWNRGVPFVEAEDMELVMDQLDILYMTRVQKERFFNEEDYVRLKDTYILTPDKLAGAKPDMAVLHPLPRVNEISIDVDQDPRAAYFEQAQNGVYVRMALIMMLLGLPGPASSGDAGAVAAQASKREPLKRRAR
jgi:aspartate carbamoyltransferase catalytic subunit